jgi:aspartate racemase
VTQPAPKPAVVGILGGMGPAAGAQFVRLFVQACSARLLRAACPVSDQAFPEHWLAQIPAPDRTRAIESGDHDDPGPLEPMLQGVEKLASIGAAHVAIACNTAHAWHAAIQQRFPGIEILHIANEVAWELARRGVSRVGVLATRGTYTTGIYQRALAHAGFTCHLPHEAERDALMCGIYGGVKQGELDLARQRFEAVALALVERHGLDALVLGCTEIPLAFGQLTTSCPVQVVDAGQVLAAALAERAFSSKEARACTLP